jgi:methionyl-tRNA formyltransferase
MRVVFMGTPDFSVPALRALAAAGHDIACVYTQPPRPAGRGQAPRPTAVAAAAAGMGLPVRTPATLRDPAEQAAFAALGADVAVVVAYGLILPQPVLDAPRQGCLNIHASLLPRWRGAAPIHRAVMAGDAETGVCIMRMEAGLDTGPVLLRQALPIGPGDTTGDLHDRLAALGAEMIVQALDRLPSLTATPQPAGGVTYAAKIDKAEARVDWSLTAVQVDRLIRGLSPHPGAWTDVGGERVRLLRSAPAEGSGEPGAVLRGFSVACGTGAVEITEIQRAGKRPMPAAEALRGWRLPELLP